MLQPARFPVVLFMCERRREGGRYWVCYSQLGSQRYCSCVREGGREVLGVLQPTRFPVVLFMCERRREGGRYWVCYSQLGSQWYCSCVREGGREGGTGCATAS